MSRITLASLHIALRIDANLFASTSERVISLRICPMDWQIEITVKNVNNSLITTNSLMRRVRYNIDMDNNFRQIMNSKNFDYRLWCIISTECIAFLEYRYNQRRSIFFRIYQQIFLGYSCVHSYRIIFKDRCESSQWLKRNYLSNDITCHNFSIYLMIT